MKRVKCPLGHEFGISGITHDHPEPRLVAVTDEEEKQDAGKEVEIRTLTILESEGHQYDDHAPKGKMAFWHASYLVCPTCGIVFRDIRPNGSETSK